MFLTKIKENAYFDKRDDDINYNKVSPNAHLAMAQPAEMVFETWIS